MSRVLSPRAYISTASCSSSAVRPANPTRTRDTNGSARSATCGTPYSMAPSAVRSRARRLPIAIPAPRLGAVLVIAAAERLAHLGLQRFLDDLPHGELEQLGAGVAVGHAVRQQLNELLACPFRGRYSRLHGDASSCRRRQPASLGFESKQECIPVSFSSKATTSPVNHLHTSASWHRGCC